MKGLPTVLVYIYIPFAFIVLVYFYFPLYPIYFFIHFPPNISIFVYLLKYC